MAVISVRPNDGWVRRLFDQLSRLLSGTDTRPAVTRTGSRDHDELLEDLEADQVLRDILLEHRPPQLLRCYRDSEGKPVVKINGLYKDRNSPDLVVYLCEHAERAHQCEPSRLYLVFVNGHYLTLDEYPTGDLWFNPRGADLVYQPYTPPNES